MIEVLSSITVISILAALLVGAIGAAHEKAKLTECINNQHQLIDAVLLYALDNEEFPSTLALLGSSKPNLGPIDSEEGSLGMGMAYASTISEYYSNQTMILKCPKVEGSVLDNPPVYSYGYNAYMKNIQYSGVKDPSLVVVFADSNQAEISSPIDIVFRHAFGSIAAFADGHVQWVKDFYPFTTEQEAEVQVQLVFSFTTTSVTGNGFTWTFLGLTNNGDGTSTFTFELINDNNKALSYTAFELPNGTHAVSPNGTYVGNHNTYTVENTTNNPFYSIKFQTVGEGVKNGESDVFQFTLQNEHLALIQGMQVQAKGGKIIGGGTFQVQ